MARSRTLLIALLLLATSPFPSAQGTPPPSPLVLVTPTLRRPVPTTMLSGQEMIALDELASLFQVTVREDTLAGGITIAYRGQTVVASTDQPMASVAGRVVSLPAAATRVGGRWLVPIEFVSRALAPIYDAPIELRRPSRLLLVGAVRVPRVTARIEAAGPPTRVVVDISPASSTAVVYEPGRVVLRIDANALDVTVPIGGGGLVQQIRPGDQPGTVTLVLDPQAGPPRTTSGDVDGITRVSIEVPSTAAPADTAASPPPAFPPAAPLPPVALGGPRPLLSVIVIDPGHGGSETGVRGAGGTEEKQLTLQVARRLRTLIESRLGVRVVLTRDDDSNVSLDERAAIANNSKADVFLSLHANAALAESVSGAEVYHLHLDREGEDARRSAETESVSLPVLGGATRTLDIVRWDLAQARHVDASAALAAMLEERLRANVPMSPRPLQEAPLRVLMGVNMPAVLLEMAYLTNAEQERLAATDDYQTRIAQALYDGIVQFRSYLEERRTP